MGTRYNRLNEAVLTCTHNICLEQKYETSKRNQLKIVIFTAVKNRCILHGRVFVMGFKGSKLHSQFVVVQQMAYPCP